MMPKVVLIATCSPCNARCPHCPCTVVPGIRDTADKYFRPEYFKKVVDECAGKDVHIRLSGYGEPLLHKELIPMLRYGKEKGCKLSLISNGSLLHTVLKDLVELELESIELSIDSHLRDVYEKIRVGLDFGRVIENMIQLVVEKTNKNKKTAVMVSIIDQPSRNPSIEDSVKFFEKFVDKVLVRKYVTWGVLPTDDVKPGAARGACPYPWERLMLDPAGNFRLCPYDDQKLIPPFGHIKDNTIEEVFNGSRFEKIRQGHETFCFDNIELCSECTDWAARSWDHNYRSALKEVSGENHKAA